MTPKEQLVARDRVEHMIAQTLDRIVGLRKSVIEVIAEHAEADATVLRATLGVLSGAMDGEARMLTTLENARDDLTTAIVRAKAEPDPLQAAA